MDKKYVDEWLIVNIYEGTVFWRKNRGLAKSGDSAIHKHHITSRGGAKYKVISFARRRWLLHRFIWTYANGEIPENMIIDHIDGNTSNNSIKNLRIATRSESSFNKGMLKNNTSGVKGVYWDKKNKKWMAYGRINGKMKNLGRFSSIEEAKKEADKFRRINFKNFYRGDDEGLL